MSVLLRFEACRALGNIAYQNPGLLGKLAENAEMNATGAADALETDSCMNIVTTNGMLEGLMSTLRFGNINSKHEAARVINNCAAYSEQAAETIAKYTGIIMELKVHVLLDGQFLIPKYFGFVELTDLVCSN
jgi:hypothetical protein